MIDPGFGIYVHWPYCAAICPYCDFNVHRARGADPEPLLAAIDADLAAHTARFGRRRTTSLFLGGGTPSLLSGDHIARLVAAARRSFDLADDAEITLEANPEDWPRFAEHVAAGVNRISIGAQALDDAALKALGRFHDSATTIRAIEAAANTGARVSLDLIYAREGQGVAAWTHELRAALKLPIEHVSLYQLTIEPSTAFARAVTRGSLTPPGAEAAADLYEATQEVCDAAGFPAYEISNHARSHTARARHNLVYWRSGDWLGIGPGAHGRITRDGVRVATEAVRRPADYIETVRERGVGWASETPLTASEIADEMLLMALRTDEGLEVARIEGARGRALEASALDFLQQQNLIALSSGRITLTRAGRLLANRVAAELSV
jgi:oxygen-independent coproporphyrinogen-3 oxidase